MCKPFSTLALNPESELQREFGHLPALCRFCGKGGNMKANTFERSNKRPSGKPHVRYVGFQSIEGGRRLQFSVKSRSGEIKEITFPISDADFTSTRGISLQDAAPMAYEKIVELLATHDTIDANELSLTDSDIEQY